MASTLRKGNELEIQNLDKVYLIYSVYVTDHLAACKMQRGWGRYGPEHL